MINYIILAGGKSKRMKLDPSKVKSKVLIPINGIPMIARIVSTIIKTNDKQIFIIVNNYSYDDIKKTLLFWFPAEKINYILQNNQIGTADCIKCLKDQYPHLEGKLITI